MRVSCLQLDIHDRAPCESLPHALELIGQCRDSELIILPELWPSGYFNFANYAAHAEPITGPTVQALQQQAKSQHVWLFSGSFVEQNGNQRFNTSLLIDPTGAIVARYRKIHTFGYQSEERRLLAPGVDVTAAKASWGVVGLSICYDLRFPELYRRLIDLGAEMFLVSAAWPAARVEAWRLLCRTRALENMSFLVACNGAGTSGGVALGGHSLVVDPWGKVVAEAGDGEQVLTCEIDLELARSARREFPALADRALR